MRSLFFLLALGLTTACISYAEEAPIFGIPKRLDNGIKCDAKVLSGHYPAEADTMVLGTNPEDGISRIYIGFQTNPVVVARIEYQSSEGMKRAADILHEDEFGQIYIQGAVKTESNGSGIVDLSDPYFAKISLYDCAAYARP